MEALAASGLVLLLGYSLGGLLARLTAQAVPDCIAHLATLGSPVLLPTASPLAPRSSARCCPALPPGWSPLR
ncbi:hypothetical protein JYK14_08955 [Siccirubricoccus sp. KC 17139]|uniref:Uncharacterized protein n=1 Tax=Siccirubricoccus soli TaxID=2899147 RepID=A0ABT1D308_9PROT|nr:hypothetical protein [Siccirubricoccus soli]MCO6416296.1 hypothetical protein [Siccirubricoccus soli]MCP2682430.1 hypothetical protein [Siccirubricoccus soli]